MAETLSLGDRAATQAQAQSDHAEGQYIDWHDQVQPQHQQAIDQMGVHATSLLIPPTLEGIRSRLSELTGYHGPDGAREYDRLEAEELRILRNTGSSLH